MWPHLGHNPLGVCLAHAVSRGPMWRSLMHSPCPCIYLNDNLLVLCSSDLLMHRRILDLTRGARISIGAAMIPPASSYECACCA